MSTYFKFIFDILLMNSRLSQLFFERNNYQKLISSTIVWKWIFKIEKNDQNLMNDWNFNLNSTKLRDHNIENMAKMVISFKR